MNQYNFYVYILSSSTGTLYIGMTNSIRRRIVEHRDGVIEGFSQKYECKKLVYYEHYQYANEAIAREKQIKKWNRQKKETLIKSINPHWHDLANDL